MNAPHLVFDRPLVRARLARAARAGFAGFLAERAAEDLSLRLSTVLRRFPLGLDLGTPTDAAAQVLVPHICDALVRAAPAPGLIHPGVPLPVIADEELLPFANGAFDLVTSLLALQSVNDLPGALVQIRRALKPDGLLLACLLGGATLKELRQSFTQAEAEIEGGTSPRVAPFADVQEMGGLMQRASFALPVVDSDTVVVRYGDPFGLLRDLRAMGLTNTLHDRRREPLRRPTLLRMAQIYHERFAAPDGRIPATFELVWLSGWAPHESQQKPLAPGSAKARLADALGTTEIGMGSDPPDTRPNLTGGADLK